MTILELQFDRPAVHAEGQLFGRLLSFLAIRRQRRAQRLALRDLVAFSPYLLDDLGITPADIAAAVEQRAFEARRRS
jgi:uncharacterized protein YjiS (DUF1127 family)